MDNEALTQIINKIPELKHKYLGTYPANFVPQLLRNSFAIINTDPSAMEGSHWILLADKNGVIYYGDSMGQLLSVYKHIKIPYKNVKYLVNEQLQKEESLCGFYCIYFAWCLFRGYPVSSSFTDLELVKFIFMY